MTISPSPMECFLPSPQPAAADPAACPRCGTVDAVTEVETMRDGALERSDFHCGGCRRTFPVWW